MNWSTGLSCLLLLALFSGCAEQSERNEMPAEEEPSIGYDEPHRPQIHFSPPTQWMNDPNGMVYHEGEYHLFYQHYPDSNVWGPMHWGHAISEDLVHWENLPIALYPDSLGWIFSGSAVVDHDNTSGLGRNGESPMVAIFTYHNDAMEKAGRDDFQYQGIAYSNDKGRSWTKYGGNPVVPNEEPIRDFRDPKVIWDAEREEWIMVFAAQDRVQFWTSKNLIDWAYESDFGTDLGGHGGVWECPDLFPLQVEGSEESKWVLLLSINPGGPNGGSATQYFVGNWDGNTFTADPTFLPDIRDGKGVWIDYGRDNYAGVTWSDIPKEDGRRIFIGWMSNWQYAREVPTEVWRSAMTVPRKLELHRLPVGYRLFSQPIAELSGLRQANYELAVGGPPIGDDADGIYELMINFSLADVPTGPFGVLLENGAGESYRVGYDPASNEYFSDRTASGDLSFSEAFADKVTRAPRIVDSDTVKFHLIFDVASAEMFADDGATVITDIFFPTEVFDRVTVFPESGSPLIQGKVYLLDGIWPNAR